MSVTEEAYQKSIALLHTLVTKDGFIASSESDKNYQRVWSRDGVVAGIAALVSGDETLIEAFKCTLETLSVHQDAETGRIPSNVDPQTKRVSYGTSVGRIDASIWFVLGVALYGKHVGDVPEVLKDAADATVRYLACLELNGRGLLYIPHGGDWADEYINHGYVLFDEALYVLALEQYGLVVGNTELTKKAQYIRKVIGTNFFPDGDTASAEYVYHKPVYEWSMKEWNKPFPIAYFTNHSLGTHVDVWAIALSLLSRSVPEKYATHLEDMLVQDMVRAECSILRAFDPVITQADAHHWEQLQKNFLFDFKNKPHHFHNGGRWPVVHGFALAALRSSQERLLERFAMLLEQTKYTFPEYFHGETCAPEGTRGLGFSAAGYVIAYGRITTNTHIV